MRLAVIVSEFPKTSETFVLRDLLAFHELGAEVRVYYLAPYRRNETLHDFARPVAEWVHHEGLISARAWGALARAGLRRGAPLAGIVRQLARGFGREPELLAKSCALLPKIAALAEDAAAWRAEHVHAAFAGHPATAAWAIGRLTGIPYSVSCHAHDIFTTQSMLDVKLGEAAFVRTISDYNKAFLCDRVPGLDERLIRVIRCGMDLRVLPPLAPRERDGHFKILFVGRLAPQKAVDVLLRAMAAGPPHWRLDVMGDGQERERLWTLAGQLGLGERVRWHGNCRFDDIVEGYRRADVVVAPSIIGPGGRTEGIPNVLMEALACHRPVVTSRVSGIPELVIDGQTGLLVPPGDVDALVGALGRIEADPAGALAMAVAGRRIVTQQFDLAGTAARQYEAFTAHCGRTAHRDRRAAAAIGASW